MNAPLSHALFASQELSALQAWASRDWEAPSPDFVKRQVLLRNGWPNATWVETGTFMGQTTALLAQHAAQVVSIEPEPTLCAKAKERFAAQANVHIVHGLSEAVFPKLLPMINGAVNFWLDGHYSAGVTHKGPIDTPIRQELAAIDAQLSRWGAVCICIDDLRLCTSTDPQFDAYPPLEELVAWAGQHGLDWHIEHDIFVAKRGAP